MADITAPVLQRTSPADDTTGVPITSNLMLGFSEQVKAGSGLIKIYKADGTLFHSIAANDTSQVTIDPTRPVVTINPNINLLAGTSYYVLIDPGAFEDLAGNDYAGLSSTTALNFTTASAGGGTPPADVTAPLLTGTSPADNAGNVAVGSNLVLAFNEAVQAGSGNIEIRNSANGTLVKSIVVTDATQVSFGGNQITVNPNTDLSLETSYYVVLASGVIRDLANNAFAGISSSATFNFTTESIYVDTTAPIVLFTTPKTNITGNTNIIVTFNEPVKAGTGSIEIRKTSDDTVYRTISINDHTQVSFSGRDVTINPSTDLDPANTYYIVLAPGAITDLDGNDYDGSSSIAAFVANAGAIATPIGTTAYGVSATAGGGGATSAGAFASAIGIWQTGFASATAFASQTISYSVLGDFIAGNDTGLNLAALSYSAMMNGELTSISNTQIDILGTDGLTYRIFGSGFNFNASSVAEVGGTGIWLVEVWAGSGADAHIVQSHYNQFGNLASTGSFDVTAGLGGDDTIIGSSEDDSLFGFGEDDVIAGREGNDVIDGGSGNDVLAGGLGTDSLTGGVGADTYKFVALAHLNGDTVNGLETVDRLDLSEIAGLSFIGANAFSGVAGQVRYAWSGGNTTLQIDSDGNGVANVSLQITGGQYILGETAPGSHILLATGVAPLPGLVLTGNGASNTLIGGGGDDVITGAGRRDILTGGGGADTFVYLTRSDSAGRNYDTITDFNASADRIDLWFQITGVDTAVTSGSLSERRFESDLTSLINSSKLGSSHAVLLTPTGGTLAGHTFLIVDANGTAGYQSTGDMIILLGVSSSLGGLTASDFV